jgi:hypothetical protein
MIPDKFGMKIAVVVCSLLLVIPVGCDGTNHWRYSN